MHAEVVRKSLNVRSGSRIYDFLCSKININNESACGHFEIIVNNFIRLEDFYGKPVKVRIRKHIRTVDIAAMKSEKDLEIDV